MPPLINRIITLTFTIVFLLNSNFVFSEQKIELTQILKAIDKDHQDFSHSFYRILLKQPQYKNKKFISPSTLQKEMKKDELNQINNVALIINNLSMIKNYYYEPITFSFIKQLLDNNELTSATILLNNIKEQGDDSLTSHADYLLARFYFQRQLWNKTLQQLKGDMSILEKRKYHQALLMKGISYQKLAKHSQAIEEYKKIPSTSHLYETAQLNLATSNLRQGWWSDAHRIIKRQLKRQHEVNNETSLNRLYITLAYSQFNQGYYRTARSTFQQVGINSKYTNQAILGIALTAAQQNDDIGALNAARFLKAREGDDLPMYEAYLLMPFFYEKSHQLVAASVGYSEASDYYKNKINVLNKVLSTSIDLNKHQVQQGDTAQLNISGYIINLSEYYPNYFFHNNTTMQAFQQQLTTGKLTEKYKRLNEGYNQITTKMVKNILQKRVDNLNSYLNQSRYGLARLFDNNTVEQ